MIVNQLFKDLARTKAVLLSRGWTTEQFVSNDHFDVQDERAGRVCPVTAVAIACGYQGAAFGVQPFVDGPGAYVEPERKRPRDVIDTLAAELRGIHSPVATITMVDWNDEHGRTQEQVLALVQAAADRASRARRVPLPSEEQTPCRYCGASPTARHADDCPASFSNSHQPPGGIIA